MEPFELGQSKTFEGNWLVVVFKCQVKMWAAPFWTSTFHAGCVSAVAKLP